MAASHLPSYINGYQPDYGMLKEAESENGPESFDSLFIDDDSFEDPHDLYGGFTMLDESSIPPPPDADVDPELHLRRTSGPRSPKTADKMKKKIVGFWNNVRYGKNWSMNLKTNFKKKMPIFFLSKCYDCRLAYEEGGDTAVERVVNDFKQDFISRIWMTYRQGFPSISGTHLTTDAGWGCMVRSGQMLLAQGLVTHFLGRHWNMFADPPDAADHLRHKEIIKWFADRPKIDSPFSIHRLVNIGKSIDKKAGEWYGPGNVATLLEGASRLAGDFVPLLKSVCVYVAYDCAIYRQDVVDLATGAKDIKSSNSSLADPTWRSVIILVPVRLGSDGINPVYIPCLKALFAYENFLGVMGGRPPGHSMYFVGFQDDKLIHLDPHLMQDTIDVSQRDFPAHSYHCVYPRKLSFTSMDPSAALGFYCRTQADFDKFATCVQPYVHPPTEDVSYPIFTVLDGCRSDVFQRQPSAPAASSDNDSS